MPRHVESLRLKKFVQQSAQVVVDRLRIVLARQTVSTNEATIVQALMNAEIEYG